MDAMSPEMFELRMRDLQHIYEDDREVRHIKMDELMCEFLRKLGYGAGVDIFEATPMWYV